MCGPLAEVPVEDSEVLARFIFHQGDLRSSDGTLRANAFLPYKHVELSVTRHKELTTEQLWQQGLEVAIARNKPLLGSGDIAASDARKVALDVEPAEGPNKGGRNHANIIHWPTEKAEQMKKALVLANAAHFVRAPN
jgi:hypothetical protein